MKDGWEELALGEVVDHRKEFVHVDDSAKYKRCRVKLHAKGIVLRDIITGADIKTKKQQVCNANEFLVAEIDAKVGGFGIVPQELAGAIVSSHYFLFTPKAERLDYRFLDYYCRTHRFRDQVTAQGSTNYAAIRPGHVLDYTIPLPPLNEQRRILQKIDVIAAKLQEAQRLHETSRQETVALLKAARRSLIGSEPHNDWTAVADVIRDIENGWSPRCHAYPATDDNWGVTKVGAVSFGKFDSSENKELPISLAPKPRYEIKSGDFLMSRANTLELVGACALVENTPPRLILCDKIFRFLFRKPSPIDPRFLDHALKSPALRGQIMAASTGTSPTMKNISKAKILRLRLPLPSLTEQQSIIRQLDTLQKRVEQLSTAQSRVSVELNALLPSILDKAFKGEL